MRFSSNSSAPIVVLCCLLLPCSTAFVNVECKPGQNLTQQLEIDEPLRLRTANYPSPYNVFNESFFLTITPPEGYNTVFLLEQFLLDPDDNMKICNSSGSCHYPKYDQTDIRRTSSFYESQGQVTISVQRREDALQPSMPHTGFSIYVKTYRQTDGLATNCIQSIHLNEQNPLDFVLSPNYPRAHAGALACNYSIRADRNVRVLAFQYNANFPTFLKGTAGHQETLIGHPTADEPLAYYFDRGVDMTFTYPSTIGYRIPQFFFIVEQFSFDQETNGCINVGSFDLSKVKSVTFGTPNFGEKSYAHNLNCSWNFHGTPPGHRMTFDVQLETEHCCDILNVTGIDNFFYDFRGDELREFGFPQHKSLDLTFNSDEVGSAVGFKAVVTYQDCQCDQNKIIRMDVNKPVDIFSAGYQNDLSYCPDLSCSWKVTFPEDYVLSVDAADVDLRGSGNPEEDCSQTPSLLVTDVFNRTIECFSAMPENVSLTASVTSGVAYITFQGDSSYFFYNFNQRARGFHLQLSLTKMDMTKQRIPIGLTFDQRTEDINLMNLEANKTYVWTISAPPSVPIQFYTLWKISPEFYVDIFDGPNESYPPLDTSLYYKTETIVGAVPVVQSTKNAMTIRVFSRNPVQRFKAVVSIGNYNLAGCPIGFLYAATSASTEALQFIVASSSNNGDEREGLSLPRMVNKTGLSVYKHVYTNDQFLLSNSAPYPHFVFDDYLTFSYNNSSAEGVYNFNTHYQDAKHIYHLQVDDTGLLFSPDFLHDSESALTHSTRQQYILDSTVLSAVKIEVLRPLGNGTLYFAAANGNYPLSSYILCNSNYTQSITYNATNIKITYQSEGGTGGMFIKYSSVPVKESKFAISNNVWSVAAFVIIFLLRVD
ncbi:hypothetical protein QR680_002220 [Steinernema hermaphroditum]|uniref:CUB domain-containing protein n=1 Tax=Steinernema hermaphroditum TaxID=289476 RepID=A0AA39H1V7_9BILA|nr:hypothetical protein QR680_002220 [Steinernema hermaphroditum]